MKLVIERFEAKYSPEPMTGCWLWTGAAVKPWRKGATVNGHGYGLFSWNGRLGMAHRFAYEHYRGPILEGMVTDHRCRTRECVNPWHLDLVSQQENLMRAESSLAAQNAAKTCCAHGHEFTAENTYHTPCGRRHCKICRRRNKLRYRSSLRRGV